jgi:3-isopropylmalate/(R)-2-methylmalate dehydratase small subunit
MESDMNFAIKGKVAWVFGDFFAGDMILGRTGALLDPNRDPKNLMKYVLTEYDKGFPANFHKGDAMIAGKVFGMARDHGSIKALKELGVSVIVAESFGRVWMRRAISNALPVLRCPGITQFANKGDELEIDLETGIVRNLSTNKSLATKPALAPQLDILEAGGMIGYLKKKIDSI